MELHINELTGKKPNDVVPITYDDILAKLNVKIIDGRMQYITPVRITDAHFVPKSVPNNKVPNNNDPKMNYIYNKYFKDERPEVIKRPPPKSVEEYNQRLAHDMRLHAIAQRQARMGKSKKLMLVSNANMFNPIMFDNGLNLNTLFHIKH
jgi:hypothetical protein